MNWTSKRRRVFAAMLTVTVVWNVAYLWHGWQAVEPNGTTATSQSFFLFVHRFVCVSSLSHIRQISHIGQIAQF